MAKELTVNGNVEVGTANLFVDTVNSRVGIGTTSPTESLQIYRDGTDPRIYGRLVATHLNELV